MSGGRCPTVTQRRDILNRPPTEREHVAEDIAERLDAVMTALGIIFLLVVLGETLTADDEPLGRALFLAGWIIWGLFVAEFAARLVIAPSKPRFLAKNWWQVLFLVLPFLRFLRLLRLFRVARGGRVVSSAVRVGRSAAAKLVGRVGWLAAITTIVILAASQLLFEFAGYDSYPDAFHDAAYSAVSGQPIGVDHALAQVLELVLALYAVIVFAFLAGTLGAYLLERDRDKAAERAAR